MLQSVRKCDILIMYQRGTQRKGKVLNITVRDLYIYSNDEQTFIIFKEGATKSCFKGSLEYCPLELIDRLIYKFRAIDFNTIEVILIM